jgi:hypothetical protein
MLIIRFILFLLNSNLVLVKELIYLSILLYIFNVGYKNQCKPVDK